MTLNWASAVRLGEGAYEVTAPPLITILLGTQLIYGYFISRRRNRYSPPRCYLADVPCVPQSNELTSGTTELVQHFRL